MISLSCGVGRGVGTILGTKVGALEERLGEGEGNALGVKDGSTVGMTLGVSTALVELSSPVPHFLFFVKLVKGVTYPDVTAAT